MWLNLDITHAHKCSNANSHSEHFKISGLYCRRFNISERSGWRAMRPGCIATLYSRSWKKRIERGKMNHGEKDPSENLAGKVMLIMFFEHQALFLSAFCAVKDDTNKEYNLKVQMILQWHVNWKCPESK